MKNLNDISDHFATFLDQGGVSIYEHSLEKPLLLILLRHVGCTFCRRTLHELSQSLLQIRACGYEAGIVHMDSDVSMEEQLSHYDLQTIPRFHDPKKILYNSLGLQRTSIRKMFKKEIWDTGKEQHKQYGAAWPQSDPMQLPGAFLIDAGEVVAGETTLSTEEQPDFLALLIYSETVSKLA